MIKILIVAIKDMEAGGVESYLLNLFENINMKRFRIDYFLPGEILCEKTAERFRKLGCNILEQKISFMGSKKFKILKLFFLRLNKVLSRGDYDIVHINTGSISGQMIATVLAKAHRIKTIIAHSHSNEEKGNTFKEMIRSLMKRVIVNCSNVQIACSIAAAKSLFGEKGIKDVLIVFNGINVADFRYNSAIRKEYRTSMNINGDYVIGHVGRFVAEKNHYFLIDIFEQIHNQNPATSLMLIGNGEMEREIRGYVERKKISDRVIFVGSTNHVQNYLCAMDCFVFPSLREGLGIVAIEAQTSGLKTICSESVPIEAKISELFEYMSLNKSAAEWAKKILFYNNGYERKDMSEIIIRAGYDSQLSAKKIEEIYLSVER